MERSLEDMNVGESRKKKSPHDLNGIDRKL
jgi:hypothetical protein